MFPKAQHDKYLVFFCHLTDQLKYSYKVLQHGIHKDSNAAISLIQSSNKLRVLGSQ